MWTGSCPCQPFSAAGKGLGDQDPRHLWPEWYRLIRECRPDTVFGEQVAGAIGHGWLDRVSADLEAEGYAVGASVLGAHSVGAPHLRQRLYFVADAEPQHDWRRYTGPGRRPESSIGGPWDTAEWLPCRDGKARPVEPGTFPLAHGVPGRVGRLRAYGNAIVPQVAAAFVTAYLAVTTVDTSKEGK